MDAESIPSRAADGSINVVIETPRASRTKYAYDPDTGLFLAKKLLPFGYAFPFPFGFIPSTRGGDGDPLDVLVITDADLLIGTLVRVRLLGVIEAEQSAAGRTVRNDRLLAVPTFKHQDRPPRTMDDIPQSELAEIEAFFGAYQQFDGKTFKVLGRQGAEAASQLVETSSVKSQSL
jgi:inorganic pyrophosphatase